MGPKENMGRSILGVALLSLSAATAGAEMPAEQIQALKPQVVNIETAVTQALAGDETGRWFGTGFIVDAELGLIVTNRHVSSKSPARYKISFYNGESTTEARLIYYDAWHDFSFLQVPVAALGFKLQAAKLGDSSKLREQTKVLTIGNNEAQEYTVLAGNVINTSVDSGDRHSATFQVSYNSQGGSSGSPIFTEEGEVVGVRYKGTKSTGLELRVEYVKDALWQIRTAQVCRRGDVGCDLELSKISDVKKHFAVTEEQAQRIRAIGENIKNAVTVERVIPASSAEGVLQPGDVVLGVDGRDIGDSLYAFDKAVDGKFNGSVAVDIVRNGTPLRVSIAVRDAESDKVTRFAQLAGGVVHPLTTEIRREFNIRDAGVFLSRAEAGSSMSRLGHGPEEDPTRRYVLIVAVNGKPVADMDAFVREASALKDGAAINITIRNMFQIGAPENVVPLTIDTQYMPFKEFRKGAKGEWRETKPQG